jgi:hypothetical protein
MASNELEPVSIFIHRVTTLNDLTSHSPSLSEAELADAYLSIIRALARSSPGEADFVVSEALMNKLEKTLAQDRGDARNLVDGSYFHRRTQHLFRAMAEVSHRAKSSKIGNVLAQFFYRHASHIASIDNSSALGQWCYAILRATCREMDRYDCLKRVLRARPDLPRRVATAGAKAFKVAQILDRVALDMRRREVRPHAGQLEALDWRLPAVRERSRSRGRQLMLSDGRLSSDVGFERDEDEVLALEAMQAERELLARADRDRRMLQLTMGRHYNDRFGTLHAGGLGDVGDVFMPSAVLPSTLTEAEFDI